MIELIATGAFKTAISKNDVKDILDNNTGLYNPVYKVVAQGPIIQFVEVPGAGYFQATVDVDKLSASRYRNIETGKKVTQYDLISGLPTCMYQWLNSDMVKIRVTETSKKDILKAINEEVLEKRFVNDDYGLLSKQNRNIAIVEPELVKKETELIIDEEEISGIDDLKKAEEKAAKVAEAKTKEAEKK